MGDHARRSFQERMFIENRIRRRNEQIIEKRFFKRLEGLSKKK